MSLWLFSVGGTVFFFFFHPLATDSVHAYLVPRGGGSKYFFLNSQVCSNQVKTNVATNAPPFLASRLEWISARPFCLLCRWTIVSIAGCLHDPVGVPDFDADVFPVAGVRGIADAVDMIVCCCRLCRYQQPIFSFPLSSLPFSCCCGSRLCRCQPPIFSFSSLLLSRRFRSLFVGQMPACCCLANNLAGVNLVCLP